MPSTNGAPRPKTWLWVSLALVIGLIVGGAIGAAAGSSGDDEKASSPEAKTAKAPEVDEPTTTTTKRVTTTTAAPYTPVPEDFVIGIVETSRACFGSAGCNVEYRIDVTYNGGPIDDDYTVVYELSGGESVKTDNFTISSTGKYEYKQGFVSTPSDQPLSAVATKVLPG